MKTTFLHIFILIFLCMHIPISSTTPDPEDALPPVKMKFVNQSRFPISIHLYMQKSLINAHFLKPGKTYENRADHKTIIHLEYSPAPYKTILKPIDSENEQSRIITFINDGEHVKVKEKFIYKKNAKIKPAKKKNRKQEESESN